MPVPLVDLKAQYKSLEEDIQSRLSEIFKSMHLFLGENVREFEKEFAAFSGARYGIGVGSGTDALVLALRALDLKEGDEVILPSHTFIATASAVVLAGARPVFVDIDPQTYNLDVSKVEDAINHHTRAIIAVHLYGHPANMVPLMSMARSRGLMIVEDASQAHGARVGTEPVGSIGDVACFSFYYSKNLGAYGEAGMVVTSNDDIATKLRMLRDHGSVDKYKHEVVGYNSRLDEVQAAVLRAKLPHLDDWNERRRTVAGIYKQELASLPLVLPTEKTWAWHVYHLYVVRTAFRDSLLEWLHGKGIGAGIHYPIPVHRQRAFRYHARTPGGLAVTERFVDEIISLPIYPEMQPSQVGEVVEAVHSFFAGNNPDSSQNGNLQHAAFERDALQ